MLVPMEVQGLALDPDSNAPVVLLRDRKDKQILPIWVGVIEASAIAFELEKVPLSRPMTHDLFVSTVEKLGATLLQVSIVDLKDSTYFAEITWKTAAGPLVIDARPSDAIALALRAQAPIFCASEVIEAVQKAKAPVSEQSASMLASNGDQGSEVLPKPMEEEDSSPRLLSMDVARKADTLQNLTDEDFGKYKM